MSYLVNLKKIGAKATVLASSLALVACGGGGGGYYGDENSSSANTGNSDVVPLIRPLNLVL